VWSVYRMRSHMWVMEVRWREGGEDGGVLGGVCVDSDEMVGVGGVGRGKGGTNAPPLVASNAFLRT